MSSSSFTIIYPYKTSIVDLYSLSSLLNKLLICLSDISYIYIPSSNAKHNLLASTYCITNRQLKASYPKLSFVFSISFLYLSTNTVSTTFFSPLSTSYIIIPLSSNTAKLLSFTQKSTILVTSTLKLLLAKLLSYTIILFPS